MKHPRLILILALWLIAPVAGARDACNDALYIHHYAVADRAAYADLFQAVEGYRPGPERSLPWPFSDDDTVKYPVSQFCPLDPGDRLVRLFEVPEKMRATSEFKTGTLTLVTRNMRAAAQAASGLAAEGLRHSVFQGRESFYFTDAAGNEFFVWAFPGPPGN